MVGFSVRATLCLRPAPCAIPNHCGSISTVGWINSCTSVGVLYNCRHSRRLGADFLHALPVGRLLAVRQHPLAHGHCFSIHDHDLYLMELTSDSVVCLQDHSDSDGHEWCHSLSRRRLLIFPRSSESFERDGLAPRWRSKAAEMGRFTGIFASQWSWCVLYNAGIAAVYVWRKRRNPWSPLTGLITIGGIVSV